MIGYNLPVSPQAWTVVIFGQSVAKTNQPLSPRKQISLFRLPKWFSMLLFWNIINNHDQSPKKNIELLVKWNQQCKFWTFKKIFLVQSDFGFLGNCRTPGNLATWYDWIVALILEIGFDSNNKKFFINCLLVLCRIEKKGRRVRRNFQLATSWNQTFVFLGSL